MGKWVKVEGKSETFQTYLMIFQNHILKKNTFLLVFEAKNIYGFPKLHFF